MSNEDSDILSHMSVFTHVCVGSALLRIGHILSVDENYLVDAIIKSLQIHKKYSLMTDNDCCVKFIILD